MVKGTVSDELMHVTDWLPTIAAISGASTKKNRALDGHNMWDVLSTGAKNPRTEILCLPPPPPPPPDVSCFPYRCHCIRADRICG